MNEVGRGLLGWLYNHNPFYVPSAALFFWGLYRSFDTTAESIETLGLMIGLAGYTVVLAVTAYLVIRFGKVWDDGRSLLVLILVMLLGLSVSFDSAFRYSVLAGVASSLGGLGFAVLVSEGLLLGLGLRLPGWFRMPYYLILATFFLYPAVLGLMQTEAEDPRVPWVLFAFPWVAGLVFLTLLPAIRRGPRYVGAGAGPWQWPWYPWVAYVVLGLGVIPRSYYLCVSMHQAGGTAAIFAPYFLVPFLLALDVLLLEIGLVGRVAAIRRAALAAPIGLVVLALLGCPDQKVPLRFLQSLVETSGATPLFWTLVLAVGFYLWAVVRRVPGAVDALTAAVLAFCLVGPGTAGLESPAAFQGLPLLAAGLIQGAVALEHRSSGRSLLSLCCLAAGAAWGLVPDWLAARPGLLASHVALPAVLLVGAVFSDPMARSLRWLGAVMLFAMAVAAQVDRASGFQDLPQPLLGAYPAMCIAIALLYGHLLGSRPYLASAASTAVAWAAVGGSRTYPSLRHAVAGLDYLALAIVSFLLALAISLVKAGPLRERLRRWRESRRPGPAPAPDAPPPDNRRPGPLDGP